MLRLLYAIPNGGRRSRAVAGKLKAEGVKPGVLDLHLPAARRGYHGLWIEMKYGRNDLTDLQRDFAADLQNEGHRVVTCWTRDQACEVLEWYLTGFKG
jgi:hypothetical protein